MYNYAMTSFSKYLFSKLQEFEKDRGQRISLNDFADYLGVSRPLISYWLSGEKKPSLEKIRIITEKFGPEVYDVLDLPRPDPDLTYLQAHWLNLPPKIKKALREEVEKYITKKE
jgi:transcriptional regulator with XRE-family HTH domain